MFSGVWKILGKTQQVIGGYMEEFAQSLYVLHTGFVPIIFNIGHSSLRHIHGLP